MIQNVRAYIMDRQEQMQRIVSYISFQRIPGEQPGIFCVAEAVGNIFLICRWNFLWEYSVKIIDSLRRICVKMNIRENDCMQFS